MAIAVVGSANADLYVQLDRIPVQGQTVLATGGGVILPGGKGANQAAEAALLQAKVYFLGQFGSDTSGHYLKQELQSRSVDLSYSLTLEQVPTGQAIIMLLSSKENSIIVIGGANAEWKTLPQSMLEPLQSTKAVLLQREIPQSVNISAAQFAKQTGNLVIMDAGGEDTPLDQELLRNLDILSPNETELKRLTGEESIEFGCQTLMKMGVRHLVVKLGSQGSLYKGEFGQHYQSCFLKSDMSILDTTGAGDCYTAALTVKLLEKQSLSLQAFVQAMEFASKAAFLSITKKGAMSSMPSLDEVLSLTY